MRISAAFLLFSLTFFSCGRTARNAAGELIADSSIRHGRELAAAYCQSCHQLPDPSLLNKITWEKGTLPAMGPRLGIFRFGMVIYPTEMRDTNVGRAFYPSQPLLTGWQWQEVIDYYSGMAPDSMPPQPEHLPIDTGLMLFKAVEPASGRPMPITCFVKVDTASGRRQILSGSIAPNALLAWTSSLQQTDSVAMKGSVVDMQITGDSGIACDIGNLNPNNARLGGVYRVRFDSSRMRVDPAPFISGLMRPVQATGADLNGDGVEDYLICEFGNMKGALSWMEGKADGSFTRHVLRAEPGAIKAYVQDVNHDGLPDIWVLFAQGDEAIYLYTNKGQGRFEERQVLRFPSVYGSSGFELADMNGDGFPDIVYTCGDNADYSMVFKPYHGVYIYLNDGHNEFTQAYFYPIDGCYKALARDFDGDGDLDLAVISFFADYGRHPEEGFVYLENKGGLNFKPYSLPAAQQGRWLTMDAGDVNGDGRIDLMLGNFSVGPTLSKGKRDWKKEPPILVLMNIKGIER